MPVMVGELVRGTQGSWMVRAPQDCPHGHRLAPNRVLVGHQPCGCGRHGHLTWECRECAAVVFAPPVDDTCRMLNGPAANR